MSKYSRGKWGHFQVFVLAEHREAIRQWIQASGMPKAAFLRAALLRGAVSLAREMGIAQHFPAIPFSPDEPSA